MTATQTTTYTATTDRTFTLTSTLIGQYWTTTSTNDRGYTSDGSDGYAKREDAEATEIRVIEWQEEYNARDLDADMGIIRPGITAALADARYARIYDEA